LPTEGDYISPTAVAISMVGEGVARFAMTGIRGADLAVAGTGAHVGSSAWQLPAKSCGLHPR